MAIELTCPNGHKLKVKESSAGKTGRCPVCSAMIRVPRPPAEKLSEEAILGILGPQTPSDRIEPPESGFPDPDAAVPDSEELMARNKTCPQCHARIELETHICPNCRTYIADLKDF